MRFMLEDAGPELHQYLVENNTEGRPFDRDTRSLMYQRAKNVADKKPFGTELDVYAEGYTWMMHSVAPHPMPEDPVAAPAGHRGRPGVHAAVLALRAEHLRHELRCARRAPRSRAMNTGAKLGRFAHDTGEGGLSKYHLENGWRPDLADRHRLLRVPHPGRRLRPGAVPQERRPRPGEDDRDQGVAGRQARPRRHPARRQGHRGDRRGPPRAAGQGRVLARPTTRPSRPRSR